MFYSDRQAVLQWLNTDQSQEYKMHSNAAAYTVAGDYNLGASHTLEQATDHLKAFGLSGRVAKTPSRGVQGPGDELIFCCHLSIMRGRREPSLLRSAEGRPP
ncbi:hypothetical protein J6590_091412 [Homalodisca vitripennis]|nr:hypothetical protein J6590_091412 [Homalodisca vitripennis]